MVRLSAANHVLQANNDLPTVFDALIHLLFEGSFLYQCFFSHRPGVSSNNFLNQPLRIYGANSGPTTSPTAMLWREYAKADARWGYSDLTVVSLELLTVLLGGPAALAVAEGIRRRSGWWMYFVMIILATAELYGGFMTFAPEWLSGNRGLDTSNWMYLWLYLVFFNVLWVFLPVFALYEAFASVGKLVEKGHEAVRHKKKH